LACCFAVSTSFSQEGTVLVAGLVKDKTGMLIANASVTEKGTQNTVATNASGLFSIRVKNSSALIVLSAVGYAPQELAVVTTGNMVVEMDIKAENLSEVAVVGYGRQKKISVVGITNNSKAGGVENSG